MNAVKTIDPRGLEHHEPEALIFPTFMAEHRVITETLNRLGDWLQRIQAAESYADLGEDLETLQNIAHHLLEAESHHQREEEALFPMLEAHQIAEPGAVMKMDHEEFRKRKQMLLQLSHNDEKYSFKEFKTQCLDMGQYLIGELENHIFKEDNIVYQIALQTLSAEEWELVKKNVTASDTAALHRLITASRGSDAPFGVRRVKVR